MKKVDIIFLLSLIFCFFSFAWLCKAILLGYYPDFNTQYYSAKYAFSGINPYAPNVGLYTPQVYPPTEFFFFLPLTLLPIGISSTLYAILSLTSLCISLIFLSKIFEIKLFSSIGLVMAGLAFTMFPVKFTLGMGQVNMFILLLLVLGLYFLKEKKDALSGAMVGLAFIIKLFPVFIPIFSLTKLKIKVLKGFLIAVVIGILVSLIFIKSEINSSFIFSFIDLANSWKLDYYNQSLSGFIGRTFGANTFGTTLRFSISGLISIAIFIFLLKNKSWNFTDLSFVFGILIVLNLILNTFSWQHHFVLLIIPFYLTFWYLRKIKARWFCYYLLGLSYFLVSVNMPEPGLYFNLYQSHVLYGSVILLGLMMYLASHNSTAIPHRN